MVYCPVAAHHPAAGYLGAVAHPVVVLLAALVFARSAAHHLQLPAAVAGYPAAGFLAAVRLPPAPCYLRLISSTSVFCKITSPALIPCFFKLLANSR